MKFWEPEMHRREFMGACAGAALTAATRRSSDAPVPVPASAEADGVPFPLTVMLWTVYGDLPFPERLEKVAEAGYHAVELVAEFKTGNLRTSPTRAARNAN